MAYTSPRTWIAGELETAAIFNTHVRDNLLEILGTTGLLSLVGSGSHTITASNATQEALIVTNSNAGIGAFSEIRATSDSPSIAIRSNSIGFATSGINVANGTVLRTDASGGMSIAATNAAGLFRFYTGGTTERARIHASGGVSIGNTTDPGAANLSVTGTLTASNVLSGTYTPTAFNGSNVDGSTPALCQYLRVGNTVTVSGSVAIDATTANTQTAIDLSLPIASAFVNTRELAGTISNDLQANTGVCFANTANDRCSILCWPSTTASESWYFQFTYQVI